MCCLYAYMLLYLYSCKQIKQKYWKNDSYRATQLVVVIDACYSCGIGEGEKMLFNKSTEGEKQNIKKKKFMQERRRNVTIYLCYGMK